MPKHIDVAELKEWVENWFEKNRYYHPYSKSNDIPIPELYDILEQMPTADVVEVVRCKDCEHKDVKTGFCEGRGWPMQLVSDDGFCDKGKRRENG